MGDQPYDTASPYVGGWFICFGQDRLGIFGSQVRVVVMLVGSLLVGLVGWGIVGG